MSVDRVLLLTNVVFEGISSACAFPYQRLFIQGFVTLRLQVKRPLADWLERPFLRAFEVLSVGSSFRLSRDGVILRFEYLMNERDCLWSNFSVSPTLVIAGKQYVRGNDSSEDRPVGDEPGQRCGSGQGHEEDHRLIRIGEYAAEGYRDRGGRQHVLGDAASVRGAGTCLY